MLLILHTTMALASASAPGPAQCSWDSPGVNPFTGNIVNAIDRYQDIPAATRETLKKRMAARAYDEIVLITRDSISGRSSYSNDIRDMHFGAGQVCGRISRAKWAPSAEERGLVYCEGSECIMVPTVCRNVSRITRLPQRQGDTAEGPDTLPAAPPTALNLPDGNLSFDAPGAGPLGSNAPGTQSFAASSLAPDSGAGATAPADAGTAPAPYGSGSGSGSGSEGGGGSGGGGGGATGAAPGFAGGVLPIPFISNAPAAGTVVEAPGTGETPGTGGTPLLPGNPPAGPALPVAVVGEVPVVAIPEPSTWAMMLGGLALLALKRRRR